MKRKIVIAVVLLGICFQLCSCKKSEPAPSKDDEKQDYVIVEDEVNVDFGSEDSVDHVTEGETGSAPKSEKKNSPMNTEQGKEKTPSNDNSKIPDSDADTNSEKNENPYDKDGDGYVDGWY